MLKSNHFEFFLALEQRHVPQFQRVQVQLFQIGLSLTGPPVAHPNVGNLRQLCEYNVARLLNALQLPVLDEVLEPLVFLMQHDILEDLIFGDTLLKIVRLLRTFHSRLVFGRCSYLLLPLLVVKC